jgi:hypothetical protein
MIPPFETDSGEDDRYQLPPGIHEATWPELVERFGTNQRRREILAGLLRALQALKAAGCQRAYVDGSFVTSKEEPGDFDGCWDHTGVDFDALDPVLLDFDGHREAQKAKFEGELFIADAPGNRFLEFFQLDRDGRPKGIIRINLADITS